MSLQIASPYIRVEDANGLPYVGAKLYVYQPGTTTLASVYTDDGLSIAAANPATSNAKGEFPRIYIAAGTYKLRAETSGGSLIFEEDNIDTGLSAGTGALPISRGGTGATTAAGARSNLDVPSNSELDELSSQVASFQTALLNISAIPQGYLTLTSGSVATDADVTGATAIYYTPAIGNLVPVYNGSNMAVSQFSELTLTLSNSHVAGSVYDVFVINDAGTIRLVTGPNWNTVTAGAGARGTGGGTTELSRSTGILTNANSMTARYGSTTLTVDANKGTYVGSIYIDGTNGQVTCHRGWGQSRKWGVWNAYNRLPVYLKAGDSTSSWSYAVTKTPQPANNDSANKLTLFSGLAEEAVSLRLVQSGSANAAGAIFYVGIGVNSTTTISGTKGTFLPVVATAGMTAVAVHNYMPKLGINVITALEEITNAASGTIKFYGSEASMSLIAEWRA